MYSCVEKRSCNLEEKLKLNYFLGRRGAFCFVWNAWNTCTSWLLMYMCILIICLRLLPFFFNIKGILTQPSFLMNVWWRIYSIVIWFSNWPYMLIISIKPKEAKPENCGDIKFDFLFLLVLAFLPKKIFLQKGLKGHYSIKHYEEYKVK